MHLGLDRCLMVCLHKHAMFNKLLTSCVQAKEVFQHVLTHVAWWCYYLMCCAYREGYDIKGLDRFGFDKDGFDK